MITKFKIFENRYTTTCNISLEDLKIFKNQIRYYLKKYNCYNIFMWNFYKNLNIIGLNIKFLNDNYVEFVTLRDIIKYFNEDFDEASDSGPVGGPVGASYYLYLKINVEDLYDFIKIIKDKNPREELEKLKNIRKFNL